MTADWSISPVAPIDLLAAAREAAAEGEIAWLDSAMPSSSGLRGARFSLLCSQPIAVLEQFMGEPARLLLDRRIIDEDASGWRLWRRVHDKLPRLPALPFNIGPGWIGYIGFEMARQLERLPDRNREELGLPLLRLALFDRAIIVDHRDGRAHQVFARGVRGAIEKLWRSVPARTAPIRRGPVFKNPLAREAEPRIACEMSRPEYEQIVRRAIEYIAAGDIYQVNLAQRLRFDCVTEPVKLYADVRRSNPAPYGALLKWDDGAVASFSPELFLQVCGERVLTCPIKGTRPRTGDKVLDDAHLRDLLTSAKEAAELAMIVDLHRNDLGRVCRFGSVRVEHARRIEAHPSVFHTVADIAGELATGRDGLDLLAACFPAGSISGVPKIRALEIIDELEPVARGVYTGAIGVLGLDGQMTFNVAIRTLQIRGSRAVLHVGGGIVADSDPAAEYEETLAKAAGIMRGLRAASGELRIASSELRRES